jgi:hypothetical protein
MLSSSLRGALLGAALVTGLALPAYALETEYVPEDDSSAGEEKTEGWYHTVELGLGLRLGARWIAEMFRGQHEFRNTLSLNEALTRTPLIDGFVIANDSFKEEALYFYHLPKIEWFGPFARYSFATSIFQGTDVRPTEIDYLRTRQNGNTQDFLNRSRLQLTNVFAPSRMRESIGVFAEPISGDAFNVDLRLGVGALQVWGAGNFIVDEVVEGAGADGRDQALVSELDTFGQAGAEFAVEASGTNETGTISYSATFDMLTPFLNTAASDDLSAWEATNYEAGINLGFAANEWLGVSYQFNALKVPSLVDEWQVTNQLLVTVNRIFTRSPNESAVEEAAAEENAEALEDAEEAVEEEALQEAGDAAEEATDDAGEM